MTIEPGNDLKAGAGSFLFHHPIVPDEFAAKWRKASRTAAVAVLGCCDSDLVESFVDLLHEQPGPPV